MTALLACFRWTENIYLIAKFAKLHEPKFMYVGGVAQTYTQAERDTNMEDTAEKGTGKYRNLAPEITTGMLSGIGKGTCVFVFETRRTASYC